MLPYLLTAFLLLPVQGSGSQPLAAGRTETAVFAGGCFWGVDAVFKHVKGVVQVVSGYAGGRPETADYESVSTGTTGHAESVEVTFDPAQITYAQLLEIFFAVAHNPTQLNRQGPDEGTQYRSAIFYTSEDQGRKARAHVAALTQAHEYSSPIVTQVLALNRFYPAVGVPPGLPRAPPDPALHRAQRPAQAEATAGRVSGSVPTLNRRPCRHASPSRC